MFKKPTRNNRCLGILCSKHTELDRCTVFIYRFFACVHAHTHTAYSQIISQFSSSKDFLPHLKRLSHTLSSLHRDASGHLPRCPGELTMWHSAFTGLQSRVNFLGWYTGHKMTVSIKAHTASIPQRLEFCSCLRASTCQNCIVGSGLTYTETMTI